MVVPPPARRLVRECGGLLADRVARRVRRRDEFGRRRPRHHAAGRSGAGADDRRAWYHCWCHCWCRLGRRSRRCRGRCRNRPGGRPRHVAGRGRAAAAAGGRRAAVRGDSGSAAAGPADRDCAGGYCDESAGARRADRRPAAGDAERRDPESAGPRPGTCRERRARDHLPAGPDGLGRPLRQQRLAPGTAQAVHQGHLGHHRLDRQEPGGRTRPARRRRHRAALPRQHGAHADFRGARAPGAGGHRVLRLRPPDRGTRRQRRRRRGGVQCLPAADVGCAVVRRRARDRQDRRQLSAGDDPGASFDGGAGPGAGGVARGIRRAARGHPRPGAHAAQDADPLSRVRVHLATSGAWPSI